MAAASFIDAIACVAAVLAGAVAALRLASTLVPAGLIRVLVAAVLAGTGAVAESLALGAFGLGGSPPALVAGVLVVWILTALVLPRPAVSLVGEFGDGIRAASALSRIVMGAAAGAIVAVGATALHRPQLGIDATSYHLPEVVAFVQSGHPGRVVSTLYAFPAGWYPLTEEVLLSWGTAITHGFAAPILLTLAAVPLFGLAGWIGLRELGVPGRWRTAAILAVLLSPVDLDAFTHPGTDLPAASWAVACGALLLGARRKPVLLAPAIAAAGLGVGTKTTVLPWCALMLAAAAWHHRRRLRPIAAPVVVAVATAIATGGVWYVRNWVDRGAPFWPFSSFPAGDPRPAVIVLASTSMLGNLRFTLFDHVGVYDAALSGGVVLIGAGGLLVLPAAFLRRGRLAVAAAAVIVGALVWGAGPATGVSAANALLGPLVVSTTRYLTLVLAAGGVAIALAITDRSRLVSVAGLVALAGALGWDLVDAVRTSFGLAYDSWLLPAVILGAGVGWIGGGRTLRSLRLSAPGPLRAATALVTSVAAAAVLAVSATGFTGRHAQSDDWGAPVFAYMQSNPAFTSGDDPVATTVTGFGPLAGDRLQHRLSLIAPSASCASIDAIRRRHWIVLTAIDPATQTGALRGIVPAGTASRCLNTVRPRFETGSWTIFRPLK